MNKDRNQDNTVPEYHHEKWALRRRFLRFLIRWVGFTLLAKLDRVSGLENVPREGPAILMINHNAFIDPIVVLHVAPRAIVPLAKIEVYDYPLIGIFPRLWGVVPVRREEVDRRAIKQALEILKAGEIILVAPEGTRGPALKEGKVGAAYLASRSGAPVIPVTLQQTEGFPTLPFTRRWRGPGARVSFGPAFRFRPELRNAKGDELRKMTDEAMYVLAGMLPPERQGYYKDPANASRDTIEFL